MRRLIFIMMAVLACTFGLSAQLRTFSGTVLDATNNEPLIGVTVAPIGGGQAVATDVDGNFTLKVPQGVTKAKFTYVGYNPATVDLRSDMKVYLQSTDAMLDEMVVVAYGTASKESLTGSVAVVNEKEIEKRPVSSVTQALEGMSPGVQVNGSTGTPGSSPSILIRGINSVTQGTGPLYVVDGVIYTGSISDINPNDVENISVLKDAASCALYGAKGANGVVMITTKRAKGSGKCDITLKIRQGVYQRGLPQYERLGYNQWNESMLAAISNGNYAATLGSDTPYTREEAFNVALKDYFSTAGVLNLYNVFDEEGKHNISGTGKGVFDNTGHIIAEMMPGYDDLDWWDAISRNGYRQEYNVSGTAATEKFNIFGSLGYLNEQGYIYNNSFERWNARLRSEFQPVKFLKFGLAAGVSVSDSDNAQFSSSNLSSTSNPFSTQTTAPGLPYYEHDWQTGQKIYNNGVPVWNTMAGYPTFVSNRGYILRANSDKTNKLAIDANTFGTVYLPYGFEFTLRASMNRYRSENKEYSSPIIGSAKDFGRLSDTFYHAYTYDFQQMINWSKEYGLHHIDVMFNHENYNKYYDYSYMKNRDQLFPDMLYINNFTSNEVTNASAYQYRTESWMGRARYNYNQQYFLELSLNRDGSSRFSKEKRWGTFWSVGASWILTKEKFMQDLNWLDFLKLRMSYGTAGNDGTDSHYPYWNLWDLNKYTLGGDPSIFPGDEVANPDIHWEATATLDAALEANLFNNRLNLSVGYFLRRNNDLIYSVSLAPSTGTSQSGAYRKMYQNIGDMHNWGWEIAIGGTLLRTKDWTWDMSVDATFIKNKIDKLPAGNQWTTNHALIEGKSRYEWYMPKWAGVDMLTGRSLYEINPCHKFDKEVFDNNGNSIGWEFDQSKWNTNLENAEGADALVKIGDKYYTTSTSYASNEFCGTSLPTVYGSFGTNLRWRDISLGMLFTYTLGGKTLDSTYASLLSPSAGSALHKDVLNSWTSDMAEGIDENSPNRINPNINPELNTTYTSDSNRAGTSRFLTSNDCLIFKNLNINYDLPKNWMKAISLKGMSIGFSVDNLFIATKRKG
ncbi:MAG: SusC/RagA family TonB-linked outer membrane protein, partial [Muribaculaceae bacterium]|nr:SusC/RagA family TonB-linked outer membrane protein [Muribaculaceae bacterium]